MYSHALCFHSQRQIVAMDHFVPATIAQNGLDFDGAFAGDPLCVRRIVSRQAAGDFAAFPVLDQHRVAALEAAIDLADAGGQQALAFGERLDRALVNHQHAFGLEHPGDPALAGGGGRHAGAEDGVARAFGNPGEGMRLSPLVMITSAPAAVAMRAAISLEVMPPRPKPGDRAGGHGFDLRRDGGHFGNMARRRDRCWDRRYKAHPHPTAAPAGPRPSWRRRARPAGHCRRNGFPPSPPCRFR